MITYLLPILFLAVGVLLTYFFQKAYSVPRFEVEDLKQKLQAAENELSSRQNLLDLKTQELEKAEIQILQLNEEIRTKDKSLAELSANLKSLSEAAKELKEKTTDQESRLETARTFVTDLKAENSKFLAENNSLKEKLETQKQEITNLQEKSLKEFENLANKIFQSKTESFSKTSQENLAQILNPLKENIQEFKKKVEETYTNEAKERFSLESKIKELVELNQQISKEANNLTKALKGQAKTQGDWGEMILESILEHSGLVKDREYFSQSSTTDEQGKRKQPDVLIKYPDNRCIIVDSKVSLTAYERFANCEDLDEQKIYLKEHIQSIKSHIDNLSSKDYEALEKSLDFVMLFVPIEPAYMTAIQYDQELWTYAYKKRVLLISPTNLIAALKMVADIWKREHQNNNALEIAKRGEMLYDKLEGFVSDLDDIGKHLEKATEKQREAVNKLASGRGNLIWQAEELKKLGLNPKKSLPEKYIKNNPDLFAEEELEK